MLSGKFPSGPVLVLASAAIYVLSFPPAAVSPLAFVSMAPLFLALGKSKNVKDGFGRGMLWGCAVTAGMCVPVHHAITVHYGLSLQFSLGFILTAMALPVGLLYGTAGAAYRYLYRRGLPFRALTVPSLFAMAEFLKEAVPLLIPWGGIGYSLVPLHRFIQMADITGVYGVTFTAVMCNSLLAGLAEDVPAPGSAREIPRVILSAAWAGRAGCALMAAAVIIPFLYGSFSTARSSPPASVTINARAVQGNIGQKERWRESAFSRSLGTHMELSGGPPAAGPRLVVWPETVLNSAGRNTDELFAFLMTGLGRECAFIAGGIRRDPGGRGFYNTAFVIDAAGILRWYDKRILLPYGEYLPFVSIFGRFYGAPAEFIPGTTPLSIETGFGRAGLSICFEVLYPWHARRAVRDGAAFLVNISNDGWFGDTSEPVMHLNAAVMRCVETRRFMVRSSNSGISAVISPSGKIVASRGLFSAGSAEAPITAGSGSTMYVILGDWVLYLSAIILFIEAVRRVVRGEKDGRPIGQP